MRKITEIKVISLIKRLFIINYILEKERDGYFKTVADRMIMLYLK